MLVRPSYLAIIYKHELNAKLIRPGGGGGIHKWLLTNVCTQFGCYRLQDMVRRQKNRGT
jgi:hypothetical protein